MEIGTGRAGYHAELSSLEHELIQMGALAEHMVAQAVESLVRLDTELARSVMLRDDEIDERDLSIEGRCLRLLALQQPMGSDLREVGTIMKMITDIERIGDLAVDIARITLKVEKEFGEVGFIDIGQMAADARSMIREALEAFVRRDAERVKAVCARDELVDDQYRRLRGQIFENMQQNVQLVVSDGWLLLAVHHLERIADHAVNIAERVNFMVTGEFKPLTGNQRT